MVKYITYEYLSISSITIIMSIDSEAMKSKQKRGLFGRIRSCGFLSIFTVDFLLFLASAGGSYHAGHSLLLPNLT